MNTEKTTDSRSLGQPTLTREVWPMAVSLSGSPKHGAQSAKVYE
jgi:hypothetical protein